MILNAGNEFCGIGKKWLTTKYTDLYSRSCSLHYTFFGSCCHKTEKSQANLCFDSSEHSVPDSR